MYKQHSALFVESSRNTGEIVTIRPLYVNDQFLHEVGVVCTRQFEDLNHHDNEVVDESQLIERVKLSSSEIEANNIRISVDLSEDVFESNAGESNDLENDTQDQAENFADDTYQQGPEDFVVSTLNPDTDDTSLFYETQTDETTLTKYAKLADDSRDEAAKCSAKLIHDVINANSEETKLFVKSMEDGEGLRTPVNSINGDGESEEVKKKLARCFDLQGKLIASHSKPGCETKQVELCEVRHATQVAKQTPSRTETSAGIDEDPVDTDFQRLVVEVVKHLQDYDLDEILSMFAGLFSVIIILVLVTVYIEVLMHTIVYLSLFS